MIKPIKIGSLELPNNLVLAPMSGVTNTSFRRLIRSENSNSVGLMVTEFISIEGMTRKNRRSMQMMRYREEERPISIQIFGHSIERMVDAAIMVEQAGADIVDINCGCPVPKVVRRGGGCELMRQPEHLAKILSSVRKAVSIPLTLKIRSGWDEDSKNALEIARLAEDCGVLMLALHGRTRQSLYRGEADWSVVEAASKELKIPVIGSGDIVDGPTAKAALERGVSGVMIGRGALSNPWIFREIASSLKGLECDVPGDTATIDILEKYMELLEEDMPERGVIGKMKQFASQVTRRVKGSTPARRAICTSSSLIEIRSVLRDWREFLEAKSTGDYRGNVAVLSDKPTEETTQFTL